MFGMPPVLGVLCTVLLLSVTLAVVIGPVNIPPRTVWSIIVYNLAPEGVLETTWTNGQQNIVWEIRFPRAILGAFVGAGLSVVGAVMQALVRNPLADPYLLGVSSGASVGAVVVLLFVGGIFGANSLSTAAFLGSLLAFLLVFAVAREGGQITPSRLILSGVAVAYMLSAVTSFLVYISPEGRVQSVIFWMLGGLGAARWSQLPIPLAVLLLAIGYLHVRARSINALLLGDETAITLGVNVNRFRKELFLVTALVTGVMVAVSGAIGFVGLMIPHVVRFIIGTDYRRLLPVSALVGSIFLVWVDVFARMILAPNELPVGIVTSALGAPFFVWLMRSKNRTI